MKKNNKKDIREITIEERKKIKEISQSLKMIPTKVLVVITIVILAICVFQNEIGIEKYQNLINAVLRLSGGTLLWRLGETKGYMEGYEHGYNDGIEKILDISDK